jgi:hypothetical protein
MGIATRVFVVKGKELKRVSSARFQRVFDGEECLPEFAGQRVKYALVLLRTENRRPISVAYTEFSELELDENGHYDREPALRAALEAISAVQEPLACGKGVVDARAIFSRRRHHWKPSPELQKAIVEAIFK